MNAWKRINLTFLLLLVLGLAPFGAAVAQIKVTAAMPASAVQGTISLDVVVSGSGFNSSAKVQYFVSGTTNPGGITVWSVRVNSSNELVTTIDVADTADLASFDIIVTLDSGRKGKGTTLFSVKAKPNGTVTPTYPPARYWHAFASNGGDTTGTSRLYMFGGITGSGADLMTAYMLALGKDLLGSVVVTVFTSNLLDKVVTALLAWGIVKTLPERTVSRLSRIDSVAT